MYRVFDEWQIEYDRLNSELMPYLDRILRKIDGPTAPQELTEPEHIFKRLHFYWACVLVNNSDVFGWLRLVIENKAAFVTVGAHGTLEALEMLMPYYRQQMELKDDIEKGQFWWRTQEERAPLEAMAEDILAFARLLLAYAKKNLPLNDEA